LKKIDLGQTVSILANIGVIAGIVFLGLELRQVQDQMEAEISFNQFSQELSTRHLLATTPSLAGAIAKTFTDEELSLEEGVMLDAYVASILIRAQYGWQQYQRGRAEAFDIQDIVRRIEEDFWGIKLTWDRMRPAVLDPEFVAAVERELKE
jgi:hypothetical protein